jgi:hypothetical protein
MDNYEYVYSYQEAVNVLKEGRFTKGGWCLFKPDPLELSNKCECGSNVYLGVVLRLPNEQMGKSTMCLRCGIDFSREFGLHYYTIGPVKWKPDD